MSDGADSSLLPWKRGIPSVGYRPSTGSDEVVLTTNDGQAIRFKESDVRPMGRNAAGVRGMKLKNVDVLVGMDVVLGVKKIWSS
jgi:DNA gyrase subunit A